MSGPKKVFVTVGTYKFDELVKAVTTKQFQEVGRKSVFAFKKSQCIM